MDVTTGLMGYSSPDSNGVNFSEWLKKLRRLT
jgi:hypothetical protein